MKNELVVEFIIFSKNINYMEISKILGLNYDSFCEIWWKMNDSAIWANNDYYIWSKKISSLDSEDINLYLEKVYELLSVKISKLLLLKKKWCEFQISIIKYNRESSFWGEVINSKYISFLWKIWANLNFDLYCLNN